MKKISTYFLAFALLLTVSAQAQILTEDFEGGALPADWTQITAGNGPGFLFGNAASFNSSAVNLNAHTTFAGINDDVVAGTVDQDDEGLMTPVLSIPTSGVPVLSFAYAFVNGDYDADETSHIYATTDGGTTRDELANLEGDGNNWITGSMSLEDYAGQDIQIIFHYSDGGGWNYAAAFDDVVVDILTGTEASMNSVSNDEFVEASSPPVSFTVTNTGAEEITSFTADFDIDGTTFSETFDAVSVSFGETLEFTSTSTFDVVGGDYKEVNVTLTGVNGSADNVGAPSSSGTVSGVLYWADRVVLLEEATGTWCGWCPRGTVFMDLMAEDYPETSFGVAVHNGDPMTVTAYDSGIGPNIAGYPSGLVDRPGYETDPGNFPDEYQVAINRSAVVDFTGSEAIFNTVTDEITINASIKFTASTGNAYSVVAVITEDGVTGTGSAWNQQNYYAGGGNGAMGGYESLPAVVPAADMVYDHVGRAIIGGWNGNGSILPEFKTADEVTNATFTYSVPSDEDPNNMHAAVFVINDETGAVHNLGSMDVEIFTSVAENSLIEGMNIYPNPAQDYSTLSLNLTESVDVRVELVNATGQVVSVLPQGVLANGKHIIDMDTRSLANGIYSVNIYTADNVSSSMISISK